MILKCNRAEGYVACIENPPKRRSQPLTCCCYSSTASYVSIVLPRQRANLPRLIVALRECARLSILVQQGQPDCIDRSVLHPARLHTIWSLRAIMIEIRSLISVSVSQRQESDSPRSGNLTRNPGQQALTFHSGNLRQNHSMIIFSAALLAE